MWFTRKPKSKLEVLKADLSKAARVAGAVHLPDFKLSEVKLPEEVRLPDVTIPRVSLGQIRRPEVQLPDMTLPRVSVGEVRRQDVHLPDITLPRLKPGEVSFSDIELKPLGKGVRKVRNLLRLTVLSLFGLAMWRELSQPEAERQWHGKVLGVPYDFRPPTNSRLREAWWNEHASLITATPWGLGWTINFWRLRALALQNPQLRQQAQRLSILPGGEPAIEPSA